MQSKLLTITALGQGFFYVLTGLWPMVSMSTFVAVTGPKTDLWLVNTVGALVLCSGLVILLAAFRKAFTREILLLAVGNALGLCAIDSKLRMPEFSAFIRICLMDELGNLPDQFLSGKGFLQKVNGILCPLIFKEGKKLTQIATHIDGLHQGIMLSDVIHQFESILPRHLDIGNHQVGQELKIDQIPLRPIHSQSYLMPFKFQHKLDNSDYCLVIIYNQYLHNLFPSTESI